MAILWINLSTTGGFPDEEWELRSASEPYNGDPICLFLFLLFECHLAPRRALFLCSVFIFGNSILLPSAGKARTQGFIKHLQRSKHQNLFSLLPLRPLSIPSGPLIILLFKIIIDLISQRHPKRILYKGFVSCPFIYELFLDNPKSLSYALQHSLDCSQKQDFIIKRHAKKEYSQPQQSQGGISLTPYNWYRFP